MPRTMFGYYSLIKTLDELKNNLKEYDGVLSKEMFEYLNSLLDLDTSVVRKEISDEKRRALANLDIYDDIADYNIYHRSLKLLKNLSESLELKIDDGRSGFDWLRASSKEGTKARSLFLFAFGSNTGEKRIEIPQYVANNSKIQEEINRIKNDMRHIHVSGRRDVTYDGEQLVGGPGDLEISNAISRYEAMQKRVNELESKIELTDADKKIINYSALIRYLFLNDFGLTDSDFKQAKTTSKVLEKTYTVVPKTITIYRTTDYI
ncbi:MAG: hypothetical protein IK137_00010 [Bacilli bacterium]|nr:hypothetical protein [Bacilli bacterium]